MERIGLDKGLDVREGMKIEGGTRLASRFLDGEVEKKVAPFAGVCKTRRGSDVERRRSLQTGTC